jgi:1-acyl-sn-glycerol-3-phosphate acyltransferase
MYIINIIIKNEVYLAHIHAYRLNTCLITMLWSLVTIPVTLLARAILFTMGWSLLDNSTCNQLNKHDRIVLVFSHTTYADFYILILYILAHPNRINTIRTLIKPQPFEYAGSLLTKMGAIPSTKVEDKNGGAVNRIVSDLTQSDKFIFLISPKGTILNKPWRSGYYHIAKSLHAPLMVAGLDYETKRVIVSNEISYNNDEPTIRDFLQDKIKDIVPLFPTEEVVPIRHHDPLKRGIINIKRSLTVIVCCCLLIYFIKR